MLNMKRGRSDRGFPLPFGASSFAALTSFPASFSPFASSVKIAKVLFGQNSWTYVEKCKVYKQDFVLWSKHTVTLQILLKYETQAKQVLKCTLRT